MLLDSFFQSNPCKHPILFLRDVAFQHLRALVEFMYAGEVNVAQAQLTAFLRTAESLQIRGLTEAPQRHKQAHIRVSYDPRIRLLISCKWTAYIIS
jgi:hypothetical protein